MPSAVVIPAARIFLIDAMGCLGQGFVMYRTLMVCSGLWVAAAGTAMAGMTVVTLTDLARLRLESLSF